MAINDEWNYTRIAGQLPFTVYAVNRVTGEAKARAAFYDKFQADQFAERSADLHISGPEWEYAIENDRGRVVWTSF